MIRMDMNDRMFIAITVFSILSSVSFGNVPFRRIWRQADDCEAAGATFWRYLETASQQKDFFQSQDVQTTYTERWEAATGQPFSQAGATAVMCTIWGASSQRALADAFPRLNYNDLQDYYNNLRMELLQYLTPSYQQTWKIFKDFGDLYTRYGYDPETYDEYDFINFLFFLKENVPREDFLETLNYVSQFEGTLFAKINSQQVSSTASVVGNTFYDFIDTLKPEDKGLHEIWPRALKFFEKRLDVSEELARSVVKSLHDTMWSVGPIMEHATNVEQLAQLAKNNGLLDLQ